MADIEPLDPEVLQQALEELPSWGGDVHGINTTYMFRDFREAMAFMHNSIEDIEAAQHHPEWANVYHTVMVTLRTHDAKNKVSQKDLDLAKILDRHAQAIHDG